MLIDAMDFYDRFRAAIEKLFHFAANGVRGWLLRARRQRDGKHEGNNGTHHVAESRQRQTRIAGSTHNSQACCPARSGAALPSGESKSWNIECVTVVWPRGWKRVRTDSSLDHLPVVKEWRAPLARCLAAMAFA